MLPGRRGRGAAVNAAANTKVIRCYCANAMLLRECDAAARVMPGGIMPGRRGGRSDAVRISDAVR